MKPPPRLLVVEDDESLREMLVGYLQAQGIEARGLGDGESLLRELEVLRPDLLVLDIGLPGISGLDVCRELRARGCRLPLMFVTARSDVVDRVLGLELGADDYLCKPFSARELLARARALLRRTAAETPMAATLENGVRLGEMTFVSSTRSLHRGDAVRVLGKVEHAILDELVTHPGEPVTRDRLVGAVTSRGGSLLRRTVDTSIMRLRRVIEPDPAEPRYIQTVRGTGYMFLPRA